jgi:hypothetical protein
MTLIGAHKLQAVSQAEACALAVSQIRGHPFLPDPVLQFFHCLRVMRVDAALEVIPQILDGVEIRTPGWEVDEVNSMGMKPGA